MTRWTRRALTAMVLVASSAFAASAASAQQPAASAGAVGTVVGQVLVEDAKTPIQGAQVIVVGTTLRVAANAEGRYAIRNVPVGSHTVRVQMLGFSPKE